MPWDKADYVLHVGEIKILMTEWVDHGCYIFGPSSSLILSVLFVTRFFRSSH